jgi:hypothetical protein
MERFLLADTGEPIWLDLNEAIAAEPLGKRVSKEGMERWLPVCNVRYTGGWGYAIVVSKVDFGLREEASKAADDWIMGSWEWVE